jgi:hypothetical protein
VQLELVQLEPVRPQVVQLEESGPELVLPEVARAAAEAPGAVPFAVQ